MKLLLINARTIICLVIIASLLSCKKENEPEPLVIPPTVNPIPYSVLVYLMTPADKAFNPDYYRSAKSTLICRVTEIISAMLLAAVANTLSA